MAVSPLFPPARGRADAVAADAPAPSATSTAPAVSVATASPQRVLVWDLPLRLFHWSLALAVPAAIASGLAGGAWMRVHGILGLGIVGLLAFRLIWGFVGSRHARFREFAPTPRALLAYVRGRWRGAGHNPLGALAVFAMLGLLLAQVLSGIFSNDDIAYAGPWSAVLADETVARVTAWHRRFAVWLYALLALHLLAIAFYSAVRRARLVSAMVSGSKIAVSAEESGPAPTGVDLRGSEYAAVLALFFAIIIVYVAAGAVLPFAGEVVPVAEPGW